MRQLHVQLLPVSLTATVILVIICLRLLLAHVPALDFFERAELSTYDWRARWALLEQSPVDSHLAVIYIDEDSIAKLNQGPDKFHWPWPRSVYGRLIRELKAQGAKVVGIDGFFFELQNYPEQAELGGLTPDGFFARELAAAGNVVLPTIAANVERRSVQLNQLPELFRTNAWRVGQDGIRALSSGNADRLRSLTAFVDDLQSGQRVWQMGLLLAARALNLDLERAEVQRTQLLIPRAKGMPLVLPIDGHRQFYIDWVIAPGGAQAQIEGPFVEYYEQALRRERGEFVPSLFKDRVVLIGYAAIGGHASDWGPSPVAQMTPQFLAHINAANSLMTGRFIIRASAGLESLLIAALAALSAVLGWRLRVTWGLAAFLVVFAGYFALAVWLYVGHRYWLPLAAPLGGAFAMGYICLLSYRMVLERRDRQRVRNVFGKILSPNVFNLLAQRPGAALEHPRRNVTIYFVDVRGFTRFLEDNHAHVLNRLQNQGLGERATEAAIAQGVHESLETVNLYLGEIADIIKAHDGTLDKYIGDCVMAFWGAPVAQERHALAAVRAAIAVHRALDARNQERLAENQRRQQQNLRRLADGQPVVEPLPVLRVGSALNSGLVTVGFMGSAAHVSNYTVFGREVNIASRLESLAEAGHILITESTWQEVQRADPQLAAQMLKLEPVRLAGIHAPVQIYEAPWQARPAAPGGAA